MEDFFRKLRTIQKKERGNSSLSRVGNDFYKMVRKFINDLKESIADDPFSEENHVLKKSIAIITEIYEKREHKIANTAIMNIHSSYHLFSGKPQFDFLDTTPLNLTPEEEKLYFSIIETLKVHRERISTDLINENMGFTGSNYQNMGVDSSQGSNLNKSIIKPDIPKTDKAINNVEHDKISSKLDKIKNAKVIEDEKKESVDSRVPNLKVNDNIESEISTINGNKVTNGEDVLTNKVDNKTQIIDNKLNKDFKDGSITNNEFKTGDSNLVEDSNLINKGLNSENKDISNAHNFSENVLKDDQFIVFDDEERYFNDSKARKKELKINDPPVVGSILFFDSMPSIMGVDSKVYGPFSPQDVATIPLINAEIIVKNKKGRLLKI